MSMMEFRFKNCETNFNLNASYGESVYGVSTIQNRGHIGNFQWWLKVNVENGADDGWLRLQNVATRQFLAANKEGKVYTQNDEAQSDENQVWRFDGATIVHKPTGMVLEMDNENRISITTPAARNSQNWTY